LFRALGNTWTAPACVSTSKPWPSTCCALRGGRAAVVGEELRNVALDLAVGETHSEAPLSMGARLRPLV